MDLVVQINGGDDVVVPVRIEAGGAAIDLSTGTLTVQVWSIDPETGFLHDATWSLLDATPDPGEAHGEISLDEAQSDALGLGRVSYLKAVFVRTSDGVTVSTSPLYLERLL